VTYTRRTCVGHRCSTGRLASGVREEGGGSAYGDESMGGWRSGSCTYAALQAKRERYYGPNRQQNLW
jgi:hypothetical protein